MTIRPYRSSDAHGIRQLFTQFVEHHAELDAHFTKVNGCEEMFINYIESAISNDQYHCSVADSGSSIIGYCVAKIDMKPPIYPNPKFGFIDTICVERQNQRRGIGEKMLEDAQKWFTNRGVDRIECSIAIHNIAAKRFWDKNGFSTFTEHLFKQI